MKVLRNVEDDKFVITDSEIEENDRVEVKNEHSVVIRKTAVYIYCDDKLIIVDLPETAKIRVVSDK